MLDSKQQIINSIPDNNCCSHTFLNVVALSSQIDSKFSNINILNNIFIDASK